VSGAPDSLSLETEEVLRRARLGERMPQTRKRRLKGTVLARIAVASTATLAAGQGAATAMGVGFVAKTVVGIALVGSLGAGLAVALRPAHRHVEPYAPRAVATGAPRIVVSSPPAVVPPVVAREPVEREPVARAHRSVDHRVAPDETRKLVAETALLRDADRALRAGDPATALARLDEHATRFPKGALAPERTAERLIVLCEVGAADPRAVEQFLAARSGSPLAARVRRACAR
jgi:hypothetical protein